MTDPLAFIEAQEATWPAAETAEIGPWRLRFSKGGGRRVGSARPLTGAIDDQQHALLDALPAIQTFYREREAPGYLQLVDAAARDLDPELVRLGWRAEAPTRFFKAPIDALANRALSTDRRPYLVHVKTPLAAIDDLWREDGIGEGRRAVMNRAAHGAVWGARVENRFAGAVFASVGDRETTAPRVAQIHALYISPWARRRRAAADLIIQSAKWARDAGAEELTIDVLAANASARSLYENLGCQEAGGYVYYRKDE
ncbi:MAG: GNAT family N-acetyltransferase [Pseudomonadota bacterium]